MAVNHRHGDLRHRRGRRHIRGNRRGRCHLTVHEGDLSRTGHAILIHRHLGNIAANNRITLHTGRAGPHRRDLAGPAFHILGVQGHAVLGNIVHPHRHRIGFELGRLLLRLGNSGNVQQHRHVSRIAVYAVKHQMRVFIAQTQRIHLRLEGERHGLSAPLVHHVEGIGRIRRDDVQRQRVAQSRGVHLRPVSALHAALDRNSLGSAGIAGIIHPGQGHRQAAPDIRCKGVYRISSHKHHHRQQTCQQTIQTRAIVLHGVSLLG